MDKRTVTCVICPSSCSIEVCYENGKVLSVAGNKCKRGHDYASAEVISPVRVLTSTVYTLDGTEKIPVKTKLPIPKSALFAAMKEIKVARVPKDIKMGDIVIENVADTGIPVVATFNAG